MKNKFLPFALILVVLVVGYTVASKYFESAQKEKINFLASENSEVFVRSHSPKLGDSNAKVVLIEYLDPECESCRAFYPIVKGLLAEFGDRVLFVVRYAAFHRNSEIAIRALEASRIQGKYWEALELLFEKQPEWGNHHNPNPDLIFELLPKLGLDMDQLRTDMESEKISEMIDQDTKDLKTLEVRGTPTFFVNGRQLYDFSPDGLKWLINDEIKKNY